MAQTFDIRFARSVGLTGTVGSAVNRFRWKGGGHLRIDAKGISIGVKRGILALFRARHTQRISNENLRAVYREGEALRVEYDTAESKRIVLPFWAGDSGTAAQIVRLLPTNQTVEIEHSTEAPGARKPRADRRVLLTIGVTLAAGIAALWTTSLRTTPPVEGAGAQQVEKPLPPPVAGTAPPSSAAAMAPPGAAMPVEAFDSIPEVTSSEVAVIPISRGTLSHDIAVRELAAFERDAASLESDYRLAHKQLMTGEMSPDDFAERLEEFEMRWWKVTFRIYDSKQLEDPALLELRRVMLGAARRWRNFLSEYAEGLRSRDQVMIAGPLAEVARAQEMRAHPICEICRSRGPV
jgi:hypothetical protein